MLTIISLIGSNQMTEINTHKSATLKISHEVSSAEPLWKRVPSKDELGNLLSDFMMIIPGLNKKTSNELKIDIVILEEILLHYKQYVVFADLNLKLNILWVSVKSHPGLCIELPAMIKSRLAKALLVSHKA